MSKILLQSSGWMPPPHSWQPSPCLNLLYWWLAQECQSSFKILCVGNLHNCAMEHTSQSKSAHLWHGYDLSSASQSSLTTTEIWSYKQAIANNKKESKNQLQHDYKVGDLVLIGQESYECKRKAKLSTTTEGTFTIIHTKLNRNVCNQPTMKRTSLSATFIHTIHMTYLTATM